MDQRYIGFYQEACLVDGFLVAFLGGLSGGLANLLVDYRLSENMIGVIHFPAIVTFFGIRIGISGDDCFLFLPPALHALISSFCVSRYQSDLTLYSITQTNNQLSFAR